MLDKYDEEEDTGMEIDESGAFNSDKAKQQAEIRAKLAAGLLSFSWVFPLLSAIESVWSITIEVARALECHPLLIRGAVLESALATEMNLRSTTGKRVKKRTINTTTIAH